MKLGEFPVGSYVKIDYQSKIVYGLIIQQNIIGNNTGEMFTKISPYGVGPTDYFSWRNAVPITNQSIIRDLEFKAIEKGISFKKTVETAFGTVTISL